VFQWSGRRLEVILLTVQQRRRQRCRTPPQQFKGGGVLSGLSKNFSVLGLFRPIGSFPDRIPEFL
jgi:hypothetical protein